LTRPPFNCASASSSGKQFRIWRNVEKWRGVPFKHFRDHYENGTRAPGVDWSDAPPAEILQLSSIGDAGVSIAKPDTVESTDDCSDLI
jgi:hypothetical protein